MAKSKKKRIAQSSKSKYLLGGALHSVAKTFGANDTVANSLGAIGGIGEMFFNPATGGVDAATYGSRLVNDSIKAYGGPGNPNKPTLLDSISVYANAKTIEDYYRKSGNYHFDVFKNPDNIFQNLDNIRAEYQNELDNNLMIKVPRNSSFAGVKKATMSDFYKYENKNQFRQKENKYHILDTKAPFSLYDRRINPQYLFEGVNNNFYDSMYGNAVNFYAYDPLAVKPFSLLTEAEKKEKFEKYGPSGFPDNYKPQKTTRLTSNVKPTSFKPKELPRVYTGPEPLSKIESKSIPYELDARPGVKRLNSKYRPVYENPTDGNYKRNLIGYKTKLKDDTKDTYYYFNDYKPARNPRHRKVDEIKDLYITEKLGTMAYGGKILNNKDIMAYGGYKQSYMHGGFTEFNGNTHEEGGVQLPDFEVEDKETMFNDYIFSNRVLVPDSKLTYAQMSKKIRSKYKRPDDPKSIEAMERELSGLMMSQENNKKIIKGREKMAYGGKPKYAYGDPPKIILNSNITPLGNVLLSEQQKFDILNPSKPDGYIGKTIVTPGVQAPLQPQTKSDSPVMQGIQTAGNVASMIPGISPVGAILNSVGPIAQGIGTLIDGPDKTKFERIKPAFVNYEPVIQNLKKAAGDAYATSREGIVNNATNSGQLLSNMVTSRSSIGSNLGKQIGDVKMQEGNINTQIQNQTNSQNSQIAMNETIANEQNKAAYRQAIYGALSDVGNIGAGFVKDNALLKAQGINDQRTLNMLSGLPGRYHWVMDSLGNPVLQVK